MSTSVVADLDADQERVAEALDRFFHTRRTLAARLGPDFRRLWERARDSTVGGKRVRPALVLAAHRELGGADQGAAVAVATAFELLHTAFLLHDDVIDGDTRRRGRPNLIGVFRDDGISQALSPASALSWGQVAAILAGDLLIPSAISLVARAIIHPECRGRMLDLLDETVFVTASGELDDVGLSLGLQPPALSASMRMTARKTAHYTFQAPLRAGAMLAGADDSVLAALDRYGHHAGVAFQLRDDLLGVFGDPAQTGKSADTDISRGKITPLMSYALGTDLGGPLRALLDHPPTAGTQADRMRALLERSGARSFAAELIDEHVGEAVAALGTCRIPESLRVRLSAVAHQAGDPAW